MVRRWRWTFWLILVASLAGILRTLDSVLQLAGVLPQTGPSWYTLMQGVRHGLVRDWRDYPNTRVDVELERAVARAEELQAFLKGVAYKRYLLKERPAR